jgi:hypothetical protein
MKRKNDGFISLIITIIIALALAKYFFDWSIFEALETEEGQGTVGYIRAIWDIVWKYIGSPLTWAWDQVIWPILNMAWQGIQEVLAKGRGA